MEAKGEEVVWSNFVVVVVVVVVVANPPEPERRPFERFMVHPKRMKARIRAVGCFMVLIVSVFDE